MKITREACKILRSEINAALAPVGEKMGVAFSLGTMNFTDKNLNVKLEVAVIGEDGTVETKEAQALRMFYPELMGKQVRLGSGEPATVIGFNRRSPKYPFIVETPGGRQYKMTEYAVKLEDNND